MTGKTYDLKGSKEVILNKTNKNKSRFTVWLGVTSQG